MKNTLFIISQYIVPQHGLSRLVGWFASTKIEFIKNLFIKNFAKKFDVNMDEAKIEDLEAFPCFNDFFTRELKDGARPIADDALVSPADGAVSQLGKIELGRVFQAKGRDFSVTELLGGDSERATPVYEWRFRNHLPFTKRLSPRTYAMCRHIKGNHLRAG